MSYLKLSQGLKTVKIFIIQVSPLFNFKPDSRNFFFVRKSRLTSSYAQKLQFLRNLYSNKILTLIKIPVKQLITDAEVIKNLIK